MEAVFFEAVAGRLRLVFFLGADVVSFCKTGAVFWGSCTLVFCVGAGVLESEELRLERLRRRGAASGSFVSAGELDLEGSWAAGDCVVS